MNYVEYPAEICNNYRNDLLPEVVFINKRNLGGRQIRNLLTMVIISMILISPACLLDFYFSFSPVECYEKSVISNLNIWLIISGSIGLVLLAAIVGGFLYCRELHLFRLYKYYIIIANLIWMGVGFYIFCYYFEVAELCEKEFKIYLWFRNILGIIALFNLGIYLNKVYL